MGLCGASKWRSDQQKASSSTFLPELASTQTITSLLTPYHKLCMKKGLRFVKSSPRWEKSSRNLSFFPHSPLIVAADVSPHCAHIFWEMQVSAGMHNIRVFKAGKQQKSNMKRRRRRREKNKRRWVFKDGGWVRGTHADKELPVCTMQHIWCVCGAQTVKAGGRGQSSREEWTAVNFDSWPPSRGSSVLMVVLRAEREEGWLILRCVTPHHPTPAHPQLRRSRGKAGDGSCVDSDACMYWNVWGGI